MSNEDKNQELANSIRAGEKSSALLLSESPSAIMTAINKRKEVLNTETPSNYISFKDNFPYIESKYVDNTFCDLFPIHQITIMTERIDFNYYASFTVSIKAFLTKDVYIEKIGAASQRIQVSREAKQAVLAGERQLTPFDYVDLGNSRKAALTLAIKNCQERFGVGADITDRIIVSAEDLIKLEEAFKQVFEMIIDPRDQVREKARLGTCKTVKDKIKLLTILREKYE